jgi:phosphoribosylformylglycinamidine synthase subunit PurQ / glutaminase
MKTAVILFPGSNCERDLVVALKQTTGQDPLIVWHGETSIPDVDLIGVPGGFSYGDYLRTGAMAAQSPVMRAVADQAKRGVRILGICNGFQIMCETGLLPGALLRNAGLKFISKNVKMTVANTDSDFTRAYQKGQEISVPVAHGEGNYFADDATLKRLEDTDSVAFRYVDNPNGSRDDIAGIFNESRTILGLMPHPERVIEPLHGGTDGLPMFKSLIESLAR